MAKSANSGGKSHLGAQFAPKSEIRNPKSEIVMTSPMPPAPSGARTS